MCIAHKLGDPTIDEELKKLKEELHAMVNSDCPSEQRTQCEVCHLELAELGRSAHYLNLTDEQLSYFVTFGMEGYCDCQTSKTIH
ncbi:hypothetical protein H6784_04905 [Candidatus Nomurabacteria bacterium]|nr:hypothetical protein [Candidatus Kaiserbacteria bacterium]MCB9814726.1 hypothetical protein [Candidatus Nomurabacteria bacterium]